MAGNDARGGGMAPGAGTGSSRGMIAGRRALLGAALAAVGSGGAQATTDPVAETRSGRVRGVVDQGIQVFKGIPYASAAERFQPAKPVTSWSAVRDAVAFGPRCPQLDGSPASCFASWREPTAAAEDCLVLNVWTPGIGDQKRRPVMVWLHGGGFYGGAGSTNVFDGTRLSRRGDVVVVTVNHRLNVFGHLYLAGLGGASFAHSGNVGTLDLLAALGWVRDNIAAFGGDPGNVTIFGQSGGGAKVSLLLAMPEAHGLFQKAIVQSGSRQTWLAPQEATENAAAFLAALAVKPGDWDGLMKQPTMALVAALKKVMSRPGTNFSPVVDGLVLPAAPWQADAPAASADVPILVGSVRTETTSLLGPADPALFTLDEAGLAQKLTAMIPEHEVPRIVAGFRKLMPQASPSDLFFAITSDRRVRQQTWAQAERKAAQKAAPVWLYELDWSTPVDGGKWGSPHSLELALVFDTVTTSPSMVGTGPEPQMLVEQMSPAWIAFARTGKPETAGLPAWPAFTAAERATLVFDLTSRMVPDFRGEERMLLAGLPIVRVLR
jgi:para-nitrobenzyl esterase